MAGAAEAEAAISKGALRRIVEGETVENPVFQCVYLKPLAKEGGPERYRVVWNDVQNYVQSMIATQLNHLVQDGGPLQRGCIVRLKQYQPQEVKGKTVIVVIDCEVLAEYGSHEKIGEPKAFDGGVKEEEDANQQPAQRQPNDISSNGFYGNKPQQQNQQQNRPLATRTTESASHGNIWPIEALTPFQHKWTIKARCTNKSDIKTWHKQSSEGKLFSVNLLDESGEIRATGFNEQCDVLYDVFHEGGVYFISAPCRVQLAKKQFSNLNHDYELMFENGTLVEKAEVSEDNVPKIRYNFTNVGDLQSVEKDAVIDTIGILREVAEVSQITSKTTSKPYDKRDLTIVDNTGFSVRLTIWGKTATSFDAPTESVVAFKGVKVSDFNGRSLSLLSSGSMTVDPDIDEAHKLKGWYDAQGHTDNFQSHASIMGTVPGAGRKDEYKTIAQVRDENLGMSSEAQYFTLKAMVVYVKQENFAYPACMSESCNKKVVEINVGEWHCEKCNITWPKPEYRYIMSVNVADHTGQLWLSCFDESGRVIMGISADELMEIKNRESEGDMGGGPSMFVEKVADANCRTWVFRCRAKMDTFQDQERVRYQVSSVRPLDFPSECAKLIEKLKQYNIDQDNGLFVS